MTYINTYSDELRIISQAAENRLTTASWAVLNETI
jgi:hypothetical protein